MDKILVPLDGSEHSIKALTFSINIAKKYPANITLMYAMHTFSTLTVGDPDVSAR